MNEPKKRYTVIKDFSLGIEATPSIQHEDSEVDLTDAQASEFAEFVKLIPPSEERDYLVYKKVTIDGEEYEAGDTVTMTGLLAEPYVGSSLIKIDEAEQPNVLKKQKEEGKKK